MRLFAQQTTAEDSTAFLKTVVLFVLVMLAIGLMSIVYVMQSQQRDGHREFAQFTSEQRQLSYSVVTDSLAASRGKSAAFDRLANSRERFNTIYDNQRFGRSADGLLAIRSPAVELALDNLGKEWRQTRRQIDTILAGRETLEAEKTLVAGIEELIPEIQVLVDEIAAHLVDSGAPASEVYAATRQLLLLQRLENNVARLLGGGIESASAADRFGRDVALFARVMDAMIAGNASLGISAVNDAKALELLAEVALLFEEIEEDASVILASSPELFKVANAMEGVVSSSESLRNAIQAVIKHYANISNPSERLGWMAGLLAGLILAAVAVWQIFEARASARLSARQKDEASDRNQRNQEAILELLDEMDALAKGDLTVRANVSEELTGAMADSVNCAVDSLRDLVTTINTSSEHIAGAAVETNAITERLADASTVQTDQIISATRSVDAMVESMGEMSTSAGASADVAKRSVRTASQGGERVRRTIQGMDVIREHIQETSKRIKRLGESSQEIGDIVGLINDIADQTNILALNAAIQAAAAGESGRGFAVVADEVQRLAERAANSTKRIEALVKTIQADTSEAIISMEKSTAEVVNGAELAERAGESLDEIENVSQQIADLINDISVAARQQSEVASSVSATMSSINDITRQTSEGTRLTARSVGELTNLSEELRNSVAGFTLPEEAMARA